MAVNQDVDRDMPLGFGVPVVRSLLRLWTVCYGVRTELAASYGPGTELKHRNAVIASYRERGRWDEDSTISNAEDTMKRAFAVWGEGTSQSNIVRGGTPTHEAYAVASKKGFAREGCEGDQWVVEVVCLESELDAEVRRDSATKGFAPIPTKTSRTR